ncbi:MAG: hypothetical protein AAB669_03625 [Patescibacteria group bacterium]
MDLKKINYEIPKNYSASPCVVLAEDEQEVLFEGLLHRIEDIDAIEGMHGEPVRLEKDGHYFEIPEEWRNRFPRFQGEPLEPTCR